MGSRLEKNSDLVRKRIESHEFHDEDGEEYEGSKFGGFADYMRRKKMKLQNLDVHIRSMSTNKPQIFRGIVAHVNGYTQPSLQDLHNLIVSHGGGFLQYLDGKTAVTHVIASHLTPKKTVEFARYRIVKPAWIVDSVNAGRCLPWDQYRVVDEGVTQKVLGFDGGRVVSQASTHKLGYRDQTETSWYTSQLRGQSSNAGGVEEPPEQNSESKSDSTPLPGGDDVNRSPTIDDALDEQMQGFPGSEDEGEFLLPEHHPDPPQQTSNSPAAETAPVSAPNTVPKPDLPPNSEKRQLTAEEHNAILLSNPHIAKSSTANPDFLNQYYRESRLHHLSTWKAELKSQLQARTMEKSASQKARAKRAPGSRRYIMHVDFDSFFAAVSLRKHPHLAEKPVVIAHGSGPSSEIASCNYPARKYGVKNGMWMKTASGLCKDLTVLPYDYKAYEEASRHFYDCILAVDGIVQSISIDEALVDVTDQCLQAGGSDGRGVSEGSIYREQETVQNLAQSLRAAVKEKTGCEVSVGMGNNILLAKVALRKAKPAGQHLIKPEEVLEFIGALQVTDLPGVAWSIGNKLEEIGIKFVKDIRACNKERLINALGPKTGEKIWDYSRGIDKQEVGDQVVRKSVSAEINWGIRFVTQQQAEEFVQTLSDELSRRLLEQTVKGKQLTMKIMRKAADAGLDPPKSLGHGKCDTFNKSVVLGVATNDPAILGKEAISILRSYGFPPGELRGLGVQMQKLEPLKPIAATSNRLVDSSQRRLQFKRPPASESPAAAVTKRDESPPASRQPRLKDAFDSIEEVPTPEKSKVEPVIANAIDANRIEASDVVDQKPLNIGGTQFIIPSQIDPTVLAELPADIRSQIAPKQKSIFDTMPRLQAKETASKSRSASPYPSDGEAMLPNQSQLDPETLAALPEDVREELLAHYKGSSSTVMSRNQRVVTQSPHKSRNAAPLKRAAVTPTKKQRGATLLGKSRTKRNGEASSSTLTQSNFVAVPRTEERSTKSSYVSDEISESFLNELPEDIRQEILAEQKRNRMQARSGLKYESGKKKPTPKNEAGAGLVGRQQTLKLPKQPDKPTFTSQKLSALPELRDAISAWVREFSADGDGPDEEDVSALADYLSKVVLIERDLAKVVGVVNWLGVVLEYERFGSNAVRRLWADAFLSLKRAVQGAVKERGLPPVVFEY